MIDARELERLMEYSPSKRAFVMDAIEFIDEVIKTNLYHIGSEQWKNGIELSFKAILDNVFEWKKIGDKCIYTGWNAKRGTLVLLNPVPDEVKNKCWEEIFSTFKENPYRETELTNWLCAVRKELEIKGYYVREIYPFESDILRIKWRRDY